MTSASRRPPRRRGSPCCPKTRPAQLATAPVIAFVHPREDATIDVFAAVANPTRRVLLLSEVEADAAQGASLQVDTVGQNYLRVTGSTATGAPGQPRHRPLHRQRRHRRRGIERRRARRPSTCFRRRPSSRPSRSMTPSSCAPAPRSTSRCSRTTWRHRARRSRSIRRSSRPTAPDSLAFASGSVLRYLAPSEPGVYPIEYSIYSSGSPALADTAVAEVTVVSERVQPRAAARDARGARAQRTGHDDPLRRVRGRPGRRRRRARPHHHPARERVRGHLGGRRGHRVHERARRARSGVVPLPGDRRRRRHR